MGTWRIGGMMMETAIGVEVGWGGRQRAGQLYGSKK